MKPDQNQHSLRRIVLPSGKSIEVVRFHDDQVARPQGLHFCPKCNSDLVQPIAWGSVSPETWELVLHCPN